MISHSMDAITKSPAIAPRSDALPPAAEHLIDGLFNSEPFSGQSFINGAGIAGDSATILPVDAIREFDVVQSASAEYGWKPGRILRGKD